MTVVRQMGPTRIDWLQGLSLPLDWSESKLKYVAPGMQAGEAITADSIEPTGTYPVYGGNGLRGYTEAKTHQGTHILIGRQGALCGNVHLVSGEFWASEHAIVARPAATVEARWLAYLLQVMNLGQYSQTAAQPGIGTAQINALAVPVPPFQEQHAIADYLDRETARIDTLIEEQQRLIEMLRERRDSAWAVAVDQAYQSGREVEVRRVITSIVDGPFGSSLTSEHYSDEGARVIRLGNIGINEFRDADEAFIPLEYADELGAHEVERNDVVVAGLGDDKMPLGRAAVVPDIGRAIVKADCYRLRPNRLVSSEYLAWVMSAPQTRSQIMLLARGATRLRLNTKVVQQVKVPVPDREEQDALVAQSVAETSKIDALIAETKRFIELAHERRSALITAAVTGQIDVHEVA
ncbi:restriction endonuclease subunit S [Microtetraspora malaysiensis]|uniref:restriction endonuclease subunit S n=1 Tax=Microtetraspora malaysiensis TaxID=161358 RepID=UPI000831AB40|nr:restriction endonuclease subunit S [Microtetraspora malaysiensis]